MTQFFIRLIHRILKSMLFQAVQDIMKYCVGLDQRNLSKKFGHSERTQSKSYGYLAHNSLAIEAVEAMEKAEKKRAKNKP